MGVVRAALALIVAVAAGWATTASSASSSCAGGPVAAHTVGDVVTFDATVYLQGDGDDAADADSVSAQVCAAAPGAPAPAGPRKAFARA
jgi:hypothetical protein